MAIKFTEVGDVERKILISLARRSGEQSFAEDQARTVIKPSLANN
jgi:hypothetical protein